MRVLGNNILIKPIEVKKKSTIITNEAEELSDRAIVEVVGNEVSEVEVGDKIFFNNRSGRFVQIDEIEYLMITEHDVFIIL